MIRDEDLDLAVSRGVLTSSQAEALRGIASEARSGRAQARADDEKPRFIASFNDIFVTIGIGLVVTAVMMSFSFQDHPISVRAVILAALSWALAEYFTRMRRMALPSIVLLGIFAASVFYVVVQIAAYIYGVDDPGNADSLPDRVGLVVASLCGVVTLLILALHWQRFKVPITVTVMAVAVVYTVLVLLFAAVPTFLTTYASTIVFASGLGVFALAMRFDLADPARLTRRSDVAFWLHLLAAPLIVHPLVGNSLIASMINTQMPSVSTSPGLVLLMFSVLAAVAVIIDRRALLVSGLSYVAAALFNLLGPTSDDGGATFVLLILGAFVLLLSAGWRSMRATLLTVVPAPLRDRLPPARARP
jgi:hypothetical protein